MAKWDKKEFLKDLRENCNREISKIGLQIIEFTEKHSDDVSWGRGVDHGTMTFRCNSDVGLIPLFHLSSDGKINILINYLRGKDLPRLVMRDMIMKLESNLLREYDPDMYPNDIFESIGNLFHTSTQVDKFIKTMEGCAYRLKQ